MKTHKRGWDGGDTEMDKNDRNMIKNDRIEEIRGRA